MWEKSAVNKIVESKWKQDLIRVCVSVFPGIWTLENNSLTQRAQLWGKWYNVQAQPLFLNFLTPRFRTHNSFPALLTTASTLWPSVISVESTWVHLCWAASAHLLSLMQGWDSARPLQPLRLQTCSPILCLFLLSLDAPSKIPMWASFLALALTQPRTPWSFSLNWTFVCFNTHTAFQKAEFEFIVSF